MPDDNSEKSSRSREEVPRKPQSMIRYTARSGGRVMFYSHDTYGLGHIRRTLSLVRALLDRLPKAEVLLATGSPVLHRLPIPPRARVVSLKPVVKVGAEHYEARDGSMSAREVVRHRASQLQRASQLFKPEVLVVDHAPLGMKGELVPTLELLRASVPRARVVLGLRDILDEPEVVRRAWREQGVYAVLERHYDRILVYGEQRHFDVYREYALPPAIRSKLEFTGYIRKHEGLKPPEVVRRELGVSLRAPLLLATVGGGGDGWELLAATIGAVRVLRERGQDIQSLLVTGPLMDAQKRLELESAITGVPGMKLTGFVPHLTSLMAASDVIVAMAGYNTVTEILSLGRPAVLVPRVLPRQEQLIRARLLARQRLAHILEPSELTPHRLADTVQQSMIESRDRPLARELLFMGGTERAVAAVCAELNTMAAYPLESSIGVNGSQPG